jgi:hypothetical protein
MLNYLKGMKLQNSRQFALFMTWFGRGTSDKPVFEAMKKAVESSGQTTLENCYKCLGEGHSTMARGFSRIIGHDARGHPNAEELDAARKWAKELTKTP